MQTHESMLILRLDAFQLLKFDHAPLSCFFSTAVGLLAIKQFSKHSLKDSTLAI